MFNADPILNALYYVEQWQGGLRHNDVLSQIDKRSALGLKTKT